METKTFTALQDNIKHLETSFVDCGDIVKREFAIGDKLDTKIFIMYIDMLTDRELIERHIICTLMYDMKMVPPIEKDIQGSVFEGLKNSGIATADLTTAHTFEKIELGILSGDTAVVIDGYSEVIIISTKGWPSRGVPTAETEIVIQGSKEAFSECFRVNSTLIRRRIRDTKLKIQQVQVGTKSATDIGIMYLDNVVRKDVLDDVLTRIKDINIDAILDSGYIEQLIEDDYLSPFPQTQITERPDKAAAAILEGRIVIIVDNSPFVIIVPATLNVFFQSSEDYYQRWQVMSFVRLLRYMAGVIAISLPGLYLAIALFHPSMISLNLILKMSTARAEVPLPGLFEVLLMELSFELLREGGIRMPAPIGSTIGIVGGIIIGQAAVDAGLVSPIVVIVVAFTAVATFAIPTNSLVACFRITKYLLTIMSAFFGFFGFCIGALIILVHLCSLKSFGFPYLYPFVSGEINHYTDYKDTIFRLPLFMMKDRPFFANPKEKTRLKNSGNIRKKE